MKRIALLIVVFVFTLLMAGWDPFMRPDGTWHCEELGITIDFSSKPYYGTVVTDGVAREIICNIISGGGCGIFYKSDEYQGSDTQLYEGYLEYKDGHFGGQKNAGKGMILFVEEKDGNKLAVTEKYTFERVYSEGEPADPAINPIPVDKAYIFLMKTVINALVSIAVILIAIIVIAVKARIRKLPRKK